MRISKQLLQPIETGYTPAERFSLRIEDGIEIYEHEAMHTCTVSRSTAEKLSETRSFSSGPKLVVDENRSRGETFISKARSDIAELTNFLRNARGLSEV